MTGQLIRHRFEAPYWYIEQQTERRTARSNGSKFPTPDLVEVDWEIRSIQENFYNSIIETLQLAVEEDCQIDSIELGYINPQSPLILTIRSGLTNLTL